MKLEQRAKLTWRKTSLFIMLVFFVSIAIAIVMELHRFVLAFPLTLFTGYFYTAVLLLPAIVTFVICAWVRPTGPRMIIVLLPIYIAIFSCIYLAIMGPVIYLQYSISEINCQTFLQSGPVIHQDCICKIAGGSGPYQVDCSLDGYTFSPLVQITIKSEHIKWR
jgi:hypothetical protein